MTYSAKAREILKGIPMSPFVFVNLRDSIAHALTLIGNEREAIGYEKGKEEAAQVARHKSLHYTEASKMVVGDRVKSVLEMQAIACGFVESKIRAIPIPPKGK